MGSNCSSSPPNKCDSIWVWRWRRWANHSSEWWRDGSHVSGILWDPEWRWHTVWTSTSPDYLPQSWENSSEQKQIWIKDRYSSQCPVIKTSSNRQTHPETKSETKDRHNKRKSSPFTVTSQWSKHSRCPHNTGSPESDTRRFPPADWAGSKDFTDAWRRKWRPSL